MGTRVGSTAFTETLLSALWQPRTLLAAWLLLVIVSVGTNCCYDQWHRRASTTPPSAQRAVAAQRATPMRRRAMQRMRVRGGDETDGDE
jgi:hypothetical protein